MVYPNTLIGYEIDFHPVGNGERSGDAITVRFGDLLSGDPTKQYVMVIDGGFVETGEALVNHIKQYYNTTYVDLVINTHPHSDHLTGLSTVIDEMKVGMLWMHDPRKHPFGNQRMLSRLSTRISETTRSLQESLKQSAALLTQASRRGIQIVEPFTGTQYFGNALTVIGPDPTYYEALLSEFGTDNSGNVLLTEALRHIAKDQEPWKQEPNYETLDSKGSTTPDNNSSVIMALYLDGSYMLFTGDAGIEALTKCSRSFEIIRPSLSFLQVPHHGSDNNVSPAVLNCILGPPQRYDLKKYTAFVSASKDSESHPDPKVTNACRRRGAWVYQTEGQIITHYKNAPQRNGWGPITSIPFQKVAEDNAVIR